MYGVCVFALVAFLMLVLRTLQQIRDNIRFGVVLVELHEFAQLLSQANQMVVFRKSLFNYRSGRWAYTAMTKDGLITHVSPLRIDDKFSKEIKVVARTHKIS